MFKRIRFAWILALVALVPVVAAAGIFGQLYLSEQKKGMDRALAERARTLAASLDRELLNQVQLLAVLAESPRLDKSLSSAMFAEVARRLQVRIPNWALIRVTTPDGRIVMTEPPRLQTQDKSIVDPETHDEVVRTARPSIGGVAMGAGGRGGLAIRVPVMRNGVVTYILTAVIRPQGFSDSLYFDDLPISWHAWLVDQNGKVVSSTGPTSMAGRPASDFARLTTPNEEPVSTGELATGEEIRTAHASLKQAGWTVHVAAPSSVYASVQIKAWIAMVATMAVTVVLGILAYVLLAREHRAQRVQEEALSRWQRMDALGRLTGQVAHDFNNLLMVFQASVHGLERRFEDADRRTKLLTMMKEGIARGAQLTQRLRSYSSKSKGDIERVDLVDVIRDCRPLLEQTLGSSTELVMRVAMDHCFVAIDKKDLQTALINLCSNAKDAMPDGGTVTLTVRDAPLANRWKRHGKQDHVEIELADTGQGFEKETARRAFEPFFTTKSGAAVGLGLTQVYGFAERSGGSAHIGKGPAGGATVVISLPRADGEASGADATRSYSLPKLILVVDDNPETLEAAKILAEEAGIQTLTAGSADEAMQILRDRRDIEALLSDIRMPGVSGVELAEEARKAFPSLKIVLMTGYSESLDSGNPIPFAVISKPFGRAHLETAIMDPRAHSGADVVPLFRNS